MAFWQNTPSTASPLNATNLNNLSGGWTSIPATLTYSSADAPTFVMSTSTNTTGYLSVGMKIKLTQTTVKYFIITAITSTTITIYGGTDYTLTNAEITAPFYSVHKAPFGFPLDPTKWTVRFEEAVNNFSQGSPVQNTWYNMYSMSVPIGCWNLRWSSMIAAATVAAQTTVRLSATLSTTNNGETNNNLSIYQGLNGASAALNCLASVFRNDCVTLTTKTTYYLNVRTILTNAELLVTSNTNQPTIIEAVCAYL